MAYPAALVDAFGFTVCLIASALFLREPKSFVLLLCLAAICFILFGVFGLAGFLVVAAYLATRLPGEKKSADKTK